MKSVQSAFGNYYPVFAATLVLGISGGLAGFSFAENEAPAESQLVSQKTEVQKEAPPASIFDTLLSAYEEKQNTATKKKPQREITEQNGSGSVIDRAQAELAVSANKSGKNDSKKSTAKDAVKEPVKIAANNTVNNTADNKIDKPIPTDSVWSAVKPNDDISDETAKQTVKQEAEPALQNVIVQKEAVQKEEAANTSVWDAVPVVVSQDGTTFTGAKADAKAAAKSLTANKTDEKTAGEPIKIAARIETVKTEEEAGKNEKAEDKKETEPVKETAKDTAAQDKLAALLAEPEAEDTEKKSDASESGIAKNSDEKTAEASVEKKSAETEPVKEEEAKTETEKTKQEKDSVVIADKGENKMSDSEKEVAENNSDKKEDKNDSKKETAKENAFSGSIPKTVELLKDLEKKNLAEKQELDEVAEASLKKEPQRLPEPAGFDFDEDLEESTVRHSLIDGNKVGDPNAKDKIKLMYDEIVNGLKSRSMTGRYEMWKNYARSTLRSTAGLNTGSEVDGRCRLTWYTQLYNEPVFSVFAVEEFSRQLHHGLSGNHRQLAEVMSMIRKKLDVPGRNDTGIRFPKCENSFDAINEVKRCLLESQMAHARAMSTVGSNDQKTLAADLYPTFSGPGVVNGHTIPNRTYGRKLVNILETIDKQAMHAAADSLLPLTNKALLALLDELPEDAFPTVHINGQQVQRIVTSAGDIIIGGRGNNIYDLDSADMKNVVCVIDLGGNDLYRDGSCNLDRPVFAVIDLHGNDTYTGSKPGIQGGSILGVSLLVDAEGNDNYSAGDVAQGSSIGGIGILLDFDGDDSYKALKRVQGHALCGVGVLCDYAGADKYRASLWAQGFGAPGGFGVLNDLSGNDHYYCGGIYMDSYPEHPGYDGWGQGVGAGIRQVANGGIGAFLEGSGDDVYEVDYFGHGGGYWLGTGFCRDFGGNDIRHGTTLMAYNGDQRTQSKWTRFANGFGCHYSLGYLFDDNGNDAYGGTIMGTGMAWDLSIGYLCDFNGSDKFTATGGMTQGVGAEGSIGILFSYGGDDTFLGRNQAYASSSITYHSVSNCGSNFSFLINYGGNDQYGCGAKNNSYAQRGSSGGFLVDRPTEEEEKTELAKLKTLNEERQKEIADWDTEQERLKEEAAKSNRRYVQRTRRPQPIMIDSDKRVSPVPSFDTVQIDNETDGKKETKTGKTGSNTSVK